jgi:putative acetyltransferase
MPIRIRMATNADVEGVVNVIHTVFHEYNFTWEPEGYHADLYDIELHYPGPEDRLFVADIDGQTVGTVGLELFPVLNSSESGLVKWNGQNRIAGADCSLERLYVHPIARRSGVGQALMQHVIHLAQGEARKRMEIWSDKRFVDAHRLYGRFGAEVVGDRILDDPDQSPEWGLRIDL